jgi:hypothetical protein
MSRLSRPSLPSRLPLLIGALLLAACSATGRTDGDLTPGPGGIDAGAAFARLKSLAGKWTAKSADGADAEMAAIPIEYSVTGGGHAVMERLFVGTDEEMTSIYYLEERDLAMVHYCSMGNRPHLRLDRAASTLDDLHFVWDGTATDIDPRKDAHIHEGRIHFVDPATVETEWAFWRDGKESERHPFTLARPAPVPAAAPAPAAGK